MRSAPAAMESATGRAAAGAAPRKMLGVTGEPVFDAGATVVGEPQPGLVVVSGATGVMVLTMELAVEVQTSHSEEQEVEVVTGAGGVYAEEVVHSGQASDEDSGTGGGQDDVVTGAGGGV